MWNIDLTYREEMQSTFERLYEKQAVLNQSRPLPNIALQKIKETLSVEWTYNSNSIEGNTLSLRETQMVIQEGITVKGKSLREHFEAKNHDKAVDYLYEIVSQDYVLEALIFFRSTDWFYEQSRMILPEELETLAFESPEPILFRQMPTKSQICSMN